MKIIFKPSKKKLNARKGTSLLSIATSAGIHLRSDCGGRGICGKCKVISHDGLSPPSRSETEILTSIDIKKGVRLACQSRILKSTEIFVPPTSVEKRIRILIEGKTMALKPNPYVKKKGLQFIGRDASWDAIRSKIKPDAKLKLSPTLYLLQNLSNYERSEKNQFHYTSIGNRLVDIEKGKSDGKAYGLALDIGTTTIVGYLIDLISGNQLSLSARMNPQTRYGGDVVSRILFATSDPQGLKKLHEAVVESVNDIIEEASQKAGVSRKYVYEICAVGNTTMHHLLLGLGLSNLTHFPYTPVIREAFTFPAKEIGIFIHPEGQVYLLPLIAGFMGSDTVGVVLATRLHKSRLFKLAIDIGTNGEIVLGNRDRLVATSCAAGPAFEGGQIVYGMPSSSGAIDSVVIDAKNHVHIHTIDDAVPLGICGSGLVDAVSEMKRKGVVGLSGRLSNKREIVYQSLARRMINTNGQSAFILWQGANKANKETSNKIYITQKDVRELQLAKGAMWAGIQILMKTMGIQSRDITEIFLAGAFGNYVKPESAINIGLIPIFEKATITPVGNAAGTGAKMALLSLKERKESNRISQKIEYIELAKHPDFQKKFIEGMSFQPGKGVRGQFL